MNSPTAISKRLLTILPPIVHKIRAQARIAAKGRLTMPQFRILAYIDRGLCNVGSLAEEAAVAQPTMSKMVDGLVNRGLIRRIADKTDRRSIKLALTKKGALALSASKRALESHMSKDFAK